jgi:hypothetical protein
MKMDQILAAIRTLAHSQGFYGRLYRDFMDAMDNSPEQYQGIVQELEAQNFGDAVDMILYFEC